MKSGNDYNIFAELEKIKIRIYCAYNEFDNVTDQLQIQAAIFRINELEARRDFILKQIKGYGK